MRTTVEYVVVLAATTLFNILLYISAELLQQYPLPNRYVLPGGGIAALGILAFAAVLPRLFDKWLASHSAELPVDAGERPRLLGLVLVAVILGFGVAIRQADLDARQPAFWCMIAGLCLVCPMIYYLFFVAIETRHQGWLFGTSLGAGLVVKMAASSILKSDALAFAAADRIRILADMSLVLALLLGGAVFAGFLRLGGARTVPNRPPFPFPHLNGRRREMILRLLAAIVLFHVMNGYLSARLIPMMESNPGKQFGFLPLALAVVSAAAGRLLDRNRPLWFRRLMMLCALAFMLVPSLVVVGETPGVYKTIHLLASAAQFTLFICATIAMANLVGGGPWWCFLLCCPFVFRFFSLPGLLLSRAPASADRGLQVVISILASMAFYSLVKSVCDIVGGGTGAAAQSEPPTPEASVPAFAPAPAPTLAPAPSGGAFSAAEMLEIFARHGLTARENEVAARVVRGLSSAEIAAELSITEHTVNTHVKNILRKFNLSSRRALTATVVSGIMEGIR